MSRSKYGFALTQNGQVVSVRTKGQKAQNIIKCKKYNFCKRILKDFQMSFLKFKTHRS